MDCLGSLCIVFLVIVSVGLGDTPVAMTLSRSITLNSETPSALLEGDMLIPHVPDATQGMAQAASVFLWSDVQDGKYEIPYKPDYPSTNLQGVVEWAFKYLELGSNVRFRPYRAGDTRWIEFTQWKPCCCTVVPVNKSGPVEVNFRAIKSCMRHGSVVHELLHALGFVHEHQRTGRDLYLNASRFPDDNDFKIVPTANETAYDMASIMHYALGSLMNEVLVEAWDKHDAWKFQGEKMFLSSCDWHALNTVYPGNRLPPKCIPGKLPDHLEPLQASQPAVDCVVQPSKLFAEGKCRFRNGNRFPDLSFIPTKDGHDEQTETVDDDDDDDDGDLSDVMLSNSDDGPDSSSSDTRSLHAFCSTFTIAPEETSESCLKVCMNCGRVWRQNLTKTNLRNCVKQDNSSCRPQVTTTRPSTSPSSPLDGMRLVFLPSSLFLQTSIIVWFLLTFLFP